MLAIIDNYDSFTYNLVQYCGELLLASGIDPEQEICVFRNDQISVEELRRLGPKQIVISPGPCTPKEAGISVPVIQQMADLQPILGVCLGHQAIGAALGGRIIGAKQIMHGKTSQIHHDAQGLFNGLANPFTATRYHSLVIERETLPEELVITAWTEDGEIMGVRHQKLPIEGVQFHPESILTEVGKDLLRNFLRQSYANL